MGETKKQREQARADARRDMKREGIDTSTACKHQGPRGSRGPIRGADGRGYTEFWCQECGKDMGKHYY
jgi:hypothetical protein